MSLPRGTLTATWQFAVFPRAPQNCRAMPTEACPCVGKRVSSRINTASGQEAIEQHRGARRWQRGPVPRTLIDELPQGLDVRPGHAVHQRRDGRAFPIEQQAAHILAGMRLTLRPPEQRRQRGQEPLQPTFGRTKLGRLHGTRILPQRTPVKICLT